MPWLFLLASLLVLGVVFRVHAFDFPSVLIYDEVHFVENARNYLQHRADWNDHPPLGKLVIATSIQLFGDRSFAWRLPALLFGLCTILIGGVTVARLFRSWAAGAVAAALLSADGFLIAFSRLGVLDGALSLAVVLALFLTTLKWSAPVSLAAGLVLGCAASFKFSGVFLAAPLIVSLALAEHSWPRKALLWLTVGVVAASTYVGLYALGLALAGQPTGVAEVVRDSQRLLAHHATLTAGKNRFISSWPTWFLPRRLLPLNQADSLGQARVMSMLGNLATWWGSTLCAVALLGTALLHALRAALRWPACETPLSPFLRAHGRAVLVVLAAAVAFLAPWVVSERDSYLYHFLPTYTALVLLLGAVVGWLRPRSPWVALGFICAVHFLAAIYGPLWSSMPVGADRVKSRLFLESWR